MILYTYLLIVLILIVTYNITLLFNKNIIESKSRNILFLNVNNLYKILYLVKEKKEIVKLVNGISRL